ncbi:MAG: hypothetical protein JSS61_03780 [Verrucomicrobia bacterium]|nr:hypothetical protein [Verrucomicrobiota bacterium]
MSFKYLLLSVITLSLSTIDASLADHLHKVEKKSSASRMENVDFIYLISADPTLKKYISCVEQLSPYGIHPHYVQALDPEELSLSAVNELGVEFRVGMQGGRWGTSYFPESGGKPYHEIIHRFGQTYFCHGLSLAAIGLALTHLSVLQDAYDAGYETIWIMEDGIQVLKDPRVLSNLIVELDQEVGLTGWDILFTDQDMKNDKGEGVPCWSHAWRPDFRPHNPDAFVEHKNIGNLFCKMGARYGTYSMVIRRCGIEKILQFFKKYQVFLPYDMDLFLVPGIRVFTLREDVVSNYKQSLDAK